MSVYSASIALPIWLLIGTIYEYYIFLGEQSYPHLSTKFVNGLVHSSFFVAGLCMLGAMGGIIWFLLPDAAYTFGASAFIALILGGIFQVQLAGWWFRDGGPGVKDDEENA